MGRPSKYKPEFAEQAAKLCALGLTDVEVSEFFGVSVRTLHRWKAEDEAFCHALKAAKSQADDRVERSLFERATGYAFVEQQAIKIKVGPHEEKVEIVDVEKQVPPDTTACIFWLKNRKPQEWRDKIETELSGPNGGPIKTEEVTRPKITKEEWLAAHGLGTAARPAE